MTIQGSLKAALAASVCFLPLHVLAQSSDDSFDVGDKPAAATAATAAGNWIEIGTDYRSAPSTYLGRFIGAVDPGFSAIGNFQFRGRDPWDSGETQYWDIQGNNLGYDDRSFMAKVGEQGRWGLSFSYDGIPYNATNIFESIWTRSGALVPGVAPGGLAITFNKIANAVTPLGYPYAAGVTGPAIWQPVYVSSPANLLYNYRIGTQRDVFAGTGKWQWNDWTITGSIRHEHKTGYQANSLNITGTPSATSSSTAAPTTFTSALGYFAQPIDYDTDRYDLLAAYGNERFQAQVGYTFSAFTDNLSVFNAANPYAFTGTNFGTAVQMASMFAPYVLPPSNMAHQVKVLLGYNVSPTTRLNANFAYGVQTQNAAYVMATGNAAATLSEPRSSLSGLVRTFFGNVALTTRPWPNLDFRLAYTIDERDNETPRNSYREDHNTLATVPATTYQNLPFSFNHQTIVAEAGYRILPRTKITLTDTSETTYRSYANTSFVTANTVTAKIRSQVLDDVFMAVSYSHQDRDAHNYANNLTWAQLGDNQHDPATFLMYFESSRVHDDAKVTVDYSPVNGVTATLLAKYSVDRYPDSAYGLRNNHNLVVGPDVNWQVTPNLSAHAFYSFQQIYYEQNSVYESSTTAAPTASQFVVPWSAKSTDSVHNAGLSVDWKAIPDVLKISLDYNFSYGDTAYALGDSIVFFGSTVTGSQITQANVNMQPLPDVTSMLNMLSIHGEYTIQPNITLLFGYAFEKFTYKDFANGVSPTAYGNLLLPGTPNPADTVHVVGAGVRIRF